MDHRSWHLMLFSLSILFGSGLGTAKILTSDKNQEIFSSSELSTTQLDDVPIVNPLTPGTGNPYPTIYPTSPQAPDTTGQTPTTPNPTTPTANPTTPSANPTTPTGNPTTPTTTPGASSGGQWCVASQAATETALQVALDYACGYGGADCSALQPGSTCYNPNTVRDHASYAFNDYYQKNPAPTSCVFGGTAALTSNDPSSGSCHYASSKTTSISPPTYVSPPSPPTPTPLTPSPPDMTNPGGSSTVYGNEPTESPDGATSASFSLLLMLACGLLATLQVATYI